MSWTEIPCGDPLCEDGTGNPRPADIVCTSLDGPQGRGSGATMALCRRHFWQWNVHSLERRGMKRAADQLQRLVLSGDLDDANLANEAIPLRMVS